MKSVSMPAPIRRIAVLFALCLCACAAPGPTIRSHVDPDIDLAKFRTFGFFQVPADRQAGYSSFLTRYIERAVADEMTARGYTRADKPDLLINFHLQTADKIKVTQTPTATGYYGWRHGYGWGGAGYQTDVSSYKEGTLNIDLVDRAGNRLVWEGIAIGRIKSKSADNPEPAIKAVVTEIFQTYPGRAG